MESQVCFSLSREVIPPLAKLRGLRENTTFPLSHAGEGAQAPLMAPTIPALKSVS